MIVRPWLLALATAVILTAASCSSDASDSDRAAAELVAQVSPVVQVDERATVEFGDDCVAEIVRDEYGFPIEVQRCDGETGLTGGTRQDPAPPVDAPSWLGSGDALAVVALVRELAITGDCSQVEFGESQLLDLDSAVSLLKKSPDSDLVVLGRRLAGLRRQLDRMQSACTLGRHAWLDTVEGVTTALSSVNVQLESIGAAQ